MAVRNPAQLNETSLTDAKVTPRTMGSKEAYTRGWYAAPGVKILPRTTEKSGSDALIVWVNDTATCCNDRLVKMLPPKCAIANG